MTTKFLAVNGPHAAGKSTVLNHFSGEGIRTEPEIASLLIDRYGYKWGRQGDEVFQKRIFELETRRDQTLIEDETDVSVETWHFGNLAHCMEIGTQSLVKKQHEYLESLHKRDDIETAALYLSIPFHEIPCRSDYIEPGDTKTIEFYEKIEENIFRIYEQYGVEHKIINNRDGELGTTIESALEFATNVLSITKE